MVWCGPLHLAFPGDVAYPCTQYSTNNIRRRKKNKNKKVALRILTHDAMQGRGLNSLVVCIDDKIRDIRERNMTIRSEI
jgi:hypothetical protein